MTSVVFLLLSGVAAWQSGEAFRREGKFNWAAASAVFNFLLALNMGVKHAIQAATP